MITPAAEHIREALRASELVSARFSTMFPNSQPELLPYPKKEEEVDAFVKQRIGLWMLTWITNPLKKALHLLDSGPSMELNRLAKRCREANDTWWRDPHTGEKLATRSKGELLMLIVSEIAEVMEGERKGLMDSHLPHRSSAEVELADVLIRVFDYAGEYNFDLDGAFEEKMAYNAQRADHKPENHIKEGGKEF